jgi:hypothetical protein
MKRLLLIGTVCLAAGSAFADLGDTYAQSCAKYGGKGYVDKRTSSILWHEGNHIVAESFYHNECVRMTLIPDRDYGKVYSISDVERILPFECGRSQLWQPFDGGSQYVASWSTTDGLLTATLYQNGSVQFAYALWLKGKGLLTDPPDYGSAPLEDAPITTQHLNDAGTVPSI